MITANDIRMELATEQRMDKTKQKWLDWRNRFLNRPLITGCNNVSIGDTVEFVRTKGSGRGSFTMTKCKGVVFAFNSSGTKMMVAYRGSLELVNNDEAPEVI